MVVPVKTGLFWQIPLFLAILLLPWAGSIDVHVASYFVGPDMRFHAPKWCSYVYTYGPLFGQTLFVTSCLLIGYGLLTKRFSLWFYSCYICLTLIISGGLIGHILCKQFWPRPRPSQSLQFGGKYPYCHPLCRYQGHVEKRLKSMPSGHATWGFYFITLFFVGRRLKNKPLTIAGLGLSLLFGCLLSFGRIVQGGHYLSDVFASAIIMWLIAYALDQLFASRKIALSPQKQI